MLGIICGSGDYPRLVAQACVKKKVKFCLLFLNGFCENKNWPKVESLCVNFGDVEKAIDFFHKNKVSKVVFAGRVKRPNFRNLSLDKKGATWLMKLGKAIIAGDDALLRAVATLMQEEGFQIISGTVLLDDVFFKEGVFSTRIPSKFELKNVYAGLAAAKDLGALDIGQSVIIFDDKVLGKENALGTNALISKCAKLRNAQTGGILAKASKPQQDKRLDLPTIGIDTVEKLYKNGFEGIAVEAEKCIVLNKNEVIKRVNELGMFLISVSMKPLKIFIAAGEASGDYLGGKLMNDISEITNQNVEFLGVGGQWMEKAGLKKIFSIKELSIIGIAEIISKVFKVKKLINKTVEAIGHYCPDIVITIDSSGFTHRVAKKLKKSNNKIPVIHYVAPPVWAWRKWRAKTMHKFIDKLMVLFPFEPPFFLKHKLETVFVGHPIATDPDFDKPDDAHLQNFLKSICKTELPKKIITLLPGSRISEIDKHLPVLKDFTDLMAEKYKSIKFIIPTIENLESELKVRTRNWNQKPIILSKKSQKILAYYSSDLAVAASGTVTLELARVNLPSIVIYKTSTLTYWIVKTLIQVSQVCLINILAKKNIVPELLQQECTAENIFLHSQNLLKRTQSEKQKKYLKKTIELLKAYPQKAALEVLDIIAKPSADSK